MRRDFKNISFALISNEILVGLVFFLFTLLIFFLINQQKLLYIISAVLALFIIGWAQFNLKRWIYISLLFLPLSPSVFIYQEKNPVSMELSDIVIWLTLFIFILNYALRIRGKRKIDFYVFFPVIIYVGISIFITLLSYYYHLRFFLVVNGIGHLIKWASYALLYFVIYIYLDSERDVILLLRIILLAFAIGAIFTLYKYLSFSGGFSVYYRTAGLIKGINGYAVLLAIILIFYYNLLLQGYARKIFPLPIFLGFCALLLLALVLTFSRTGWATLWLFVIIITFYRKRRMLGIVLIIFSALNFYIVREPVKERIEMTFEQEKGSPLPLNLSGRYGIWSMTIRRTIRKFYIGVGYQNFLQHIAGTSPHNQYLALFAETGIWGLLAFLFLIYRLVKALIYLSQNNQGIFKEFAFGSLMVLIALLFASLAGEFFYSARIILTYMTFLVCARLGFQFQKEREICYQKIPLMMSNLRYV